MTDQPVPEPPTFTEGQRVLVYATVVEPEPDADGELLLAAEGSSPIDRPSIWLKPEHVHPAAPVEQRGAAGALLASFRAPRMHHGAEPVPQRVLCALDQCEHLSGVGIDGCYGSPTPPEIVAVRDARRAPAFGCHKTDAWPTPGQAAYEAFRRNDPYPWADVSDRGRARWESAALAGHKAHQATERLLSWVDGGAEAALRRALIEQHDHHDDGRASHPELDWITECPTCMPEPVDRAALYEKARSLVADTLVMGNRSPADATRKIGHVASARLVVEVARFLAGDPS